MPKKERDEVLSGLTSKIYSEMLEEILMDVVLESHQQIARSTAICNICHTRCCAVHVPGPSSVATQAAASSSRLPSPSDEARVADANSPAGTGTNTSMNGKVNGNILLECVICKRQIASNRYASHLGDCMGLGNSRRGAIRSATTKTKLASEAGRSASPYLGSENGNISDDGTNANTGKGKGKSKAKRTDDAEYSLNRKRPGSPSLSPVKRGKKAKTSGSPVARVKADPDTPGSPSNSFVLPQTSSQLKVPSKLRDSSIVSSVNREQRSSSPESPSRLSSPARSVSTVASALSIRSPTLSASAMQKSKGKNSKPAPAPPAKRPSPPRPPPPVIRMPEPDFLVDVEGDETGSSTDTDSS